MEIKTKFEIGQDIWFMEDNQPRKAEVTKISIDIRPNQYTIVGVLILYHYGGYIEKIVNENRCYSSKKELVESFLKE